MTTVSLVLRGVVSYIDKHDQLFLSLDDEEYPETKRKLISYASAGSHLPFDEHQVKIKLPAKMTKSQFAEFEGRHVKITVRLTKYQFVSKSNYNFNETVSGVKLTIIDIERA